MTWTPLWIFAIDLLSNFLTFSLFSESFYVFPSGKRLNKLAFAIAKKKISSLKLGTRLFY